MLHLICLAALNIFPSRGRLGTTARQLFRASTFGVAGTPTVRKLTFGNPCPVARSDGRGERLVYFSLRATSVPASRDTSPVGEATEERRERNVRAAGFRSPQAACGISRCAPRNISRPWTYRAQRFSTYCFLQKGKKDNALSFSVLLSVTRRIRRSGRFF